MDQIDLHGWLSRILLDEYRRLGDRLHPGDVDEECPKETEKFAEWLADLASRPVGVEGSLKFNGLNFRVAIIFVAQRHVFLDHGIEPYRKRTKRHLYTDKYDSVYLMARDANIPAVEELVASLGDDAMIASKKTYVYRLRSDFKARVLHRERAICVCLRRRQEGGEPEEVSEEDVGLLDEAYEALPAENAAPAGSLGASQPPAVE